MNIKSLLTQQAHVRNNAPAVIFNERSISFGELKDRSFSCAQFLLSSGLSSTDKVAVYLPNTPETITVFFGIFSIGASIVPLDFMLTEEEIIAVINHSEASLLFLHLKKGINLARIKARCPSLKNLLAFGASGGLSPWSDIYSAYAPEEPDVSIDEKSLSSIFYTSGSTGHPKGVMLRFSHFDCPIKTISHFLNVQSQDIFLCAGVPFSHIGGLDYMLFMLSFGSTLILMERFLPFEFLKNIERYKVTIFCVVPAMFVTVLSLKEYAAFDLSSLRYAVVFGAPSSPALLKRFHKSYPNACLLNGWGMTETAAPNTYSPKDIAKIESIGKLDFNIRAKIVDGAGKEVPAGNQGELWVKGESLMKGYYKEPELTAQTITQDGWLKTGDIARKDRQGDIYIVGRKKDMIKVAGEIVFSGEVENALVKCPQVKEAAVIGVPDRLRGEVPKAFVVAADKEPPDTQMLRDFLKAHIAHFKIPHYFEFVNDLPRNRTGKVDKKELRQRTGPFPVSQEAGTEEAG